MNHRNEDLTTGPIIQKLLRFALPLLLGTLVQQLYSTVDLIFVGNMIDSSASAAIGASAMLITCLIGFFGGMAVGTGIVIARSRGARDADKLRRAIRSTAALALASASGKMKVDTKKVATFIFLLCCRIGVRKEVKA